MEELACISLKPSRIAMGVRRIVLAMSLAAIGLSGLSWTFKGCLGLLLLLAGLYDRDKQGKAVITGIGYGEQRGWVMINQEKVAVDLQGEQLVLPWLVVVQWQERESRKKGALALWPDSAATDDLRRLRIFLRMGSIS